ncbi:MAG TPA: YIP1 family protein [Ignavibacteriales bacterium]|nr:YIP1 family protein [Ignavibacteriales bacterium]
MKNVITCRNCSGENPYFSLICGHCNAFLRERVVNIDLWNTVGQLVESPLKAFRNIIHAEHKNFIFFLSFLIGIKFFIDALILSEPIFGGTKIFYNSVGVFFTSVAAVPAAAALFSLLFTYLTKTFKVKTRYKDNFSLLIYSQLPHVFALVFLFPVELVLFGGFLFSTNPSPFLLKPTPAYTMSIMEGIMFLWALVLGFWACYAATRAKLYSLLVSLLYNIISILVILAISAVFSY